MDLSKSIIKKLWMIFIIIGLVIILLPVMEETELRHKSVEAKACFAELTPKELEENEKKKGTFEFEKVEDIASLQVITEKSEIKDHPIIGQLVIDSLNIKLPVLKGMDKNNLKIGVGTMKDGQKMGKGNYALAGHYNNSDDILFGGLLDIEEGDIVSITDKKMVYEYEIYETAVVSETEVELLSDDKATERGNSIITLMTCYYSSKTGKRFFAFGDLINKYTNVYLN